MNGSCVGIKRCLRKPHAERYPRSFSGTCRIVGVSQVSHEVSHRTLVGHCGDTDAQSEAEEDADEDGVSDVHVRAILAAERMRRERIAPRIAGLVDDLLAG